MTNPLTRADSWDAVAQAYDAFIVPVFTRFADSALQQLPELPPAGARALDIACGPGTVSILLAKRGLDVAAIDFSEGMLEQCRRRASREAVQLNVRQMDGQALQFDPAQFALAVSMFGWMFFPDRHQGLTEIYRVLQPGGQLVLSSWAPVEDSPLMQLIFGALGAMVPELPEPEDTGPGLEDPNVFESELRAAGFDQVRIERKTQGFPIEDIETFWAGAAESSAPLVLQRRKLGEAAWQERLPAAHRFLRGHLPQLPTTKTSDAWVATARKPT